MKLEYILVLRLFLSDFFAYPTQNERGIYIRSQSPSFSLSTLLHLAFSISTIALDTFYHRTTQSIASTVGKNVNKKGIESCK